MLAVCAFVLIASNSPRILLNFSFATSNAVPLLGLATEERFFSYLPLCHIAERLLVEMGSLYSGGMVSFAESLDTFAQNLADTKPTAFLGACTISLTMGFLFMMFISVMQFLLVGNIPNV